MQVTLPIAAQKENMFGFIHDKYLYIYSKHNPRYKFLAAASVQGVFEDPVAASEFKDCATGNPCYTDDSQYPIKSWMIPALKESILKSNLMIQAQAETMASDESNNATSDTKK